DLAIFHASLFEDKDICHGDHVTFHTTDLSDRGDLPSAIAHAFLLTDHIHRTRNLLTNGAYREIHPGHQTHGFHACERVAWRIGMRGSHGTIVTRVHGLQHVQRFTAAAFSNDNAFGTHTQRVNHEVTDGDFATSFNIGWAGFKRNHM